MTNNKLGKIELLLFLIALAAVTASLYYLGPSMTGFLVKEISYINDVNLVVASSGNYTLNAANTGALNSLKLDGRVTNYGKARVYLESNGVKYLIFDSSKLNETKQKSNESSLITGFAVNENDKNDTASDKDKKKKNSKPEWTGNGEFIIDGTALINLSQYFSDKDNDFLIYSASEAEGLEITINDGMTTIKPEKNEEFNTTITFTASDGIDSKSETVKLIIIKNANTTQANQTIENQSIDITPILNETINQTIWTNQTKTISINLAYKSGTIYDANDNGEESVNGVVDLTVENSSFNWDADKSRLCARWSVYNIEEGKITILCNGNDDCCAFAGLLPSKSSWNDVYYAVFGKEGAGHSNIVSAQVIYYDVNLSAENPKSEIYYSGFGNLSVEFFEEEIEFFDKCAETCSLNGLNKSSYNLVFEIEDNAVLRIDKIKYNMLTDVENSAPFLIQNFSTVNVPKNKNTTINLSEYFADPDGDALAYGYYKADNITILFDKDIAAIIPDKGFEGIQFTYLTANDSESFAVSNVFMINISEEKQKPRVEIGRPVKWQSKILIDLNNVSSVNLSLPETASNISIKILNETLQKELPDEKIKVIEDGKIKDKGLFELEKQIENINKKISILEEAKKKDASKVTVDETEFEAHELGSKLNELYSKKSKLEQQLNLMLNVNGNLITANAVALTESVVNDTQPVLFINETFAKNVEVQIEYETEAPIAIEDEISANTKQIRIVSETSYEDVLSYTSLNDVPQSAIKLYWMQNNERVLFNDADYLDENANGLIDKIEWIIPHLSNQTFEVTITVLNVQSYPTVGGNWTVGFNTTGTGNLSVYAYDGTSYAEVPDDSSTINDLEYLETRCNDVVLNTTIVCSNGEHMPYEVYKIKKRIAEIRKRLDELNQSG